jgi:PBSX family phage terminase large subunit
MSISAKDAIRELWYRGNITWKLHDVQKKMLSSYLTQNENITVIACSRRLGKSYLLCLLAVETCLKKQNAIVKYVCPKKNMVKTILQPIMNDILKDCPAELKPEFKYNDYMYVFPNGSQIQMAGTDNGHHENLRGGKSDMWVVDEAGFCDELNYVVNTILAPTTDTTGGRGIIASTPSKTADHEFITEFYQPYELDDKLIKYTIYDNPLLSKSKIEEIIRRYPKREKNPEFRREYLCEVVSGSDLSVVPEFTEDLEKKIVIETERPPFYDAYVSMDIGGKDLTVLLFAYYDFKKASIVIEDELVFHKQTENLIQNSRNDLLAKEIRKTEEKLWTHPMSGEFKKPYMRIADNNNPILLNDLSYQYNLTFIPTRKDNREAALNTMRVMIAEEKIIIHPRCKTLIFHLKNATWAPNKKDFSRSKNNGHWDAVPALMYLVRNVVLSKNPFPAGHMTADMFQPNGEKPKTKAEQAWVSIFKTRSSLK